MCRIQALLISYSKRLCRLLHVEHKKKSVCWLQEDRPSWRSAATLALSLAPRVTSIPHVVPHVVVLSRSPSPLQRSVQIIDCKLSSRSFHILVASRDNNLTMGKRSRQQKRDAAGSAGQNVPDNLKVDVDGRVDAQQGSSNRYHQERKVLQPLNKIPTKINLVVIGTGGPGSSRALLVTTEYTRYLINCGEGAQRLAAMSKSLRSSAFAKLAGIEHIFITHKSWENTGGLLGVAMALEGQKNPDAKVFVKRDQPLQEEQSKDLPKITIHGPPGVENIAMMAKKFSVHANMDIVRHEGDFKDAGLTITHIPIYKQTTEVFTKADELDTCSPGLAKRRRKSSVSTSVSPSSRDLAYAYIFEAQPQLPKIDIEKCFNAGVTIGPMVGCLQRGESVVLEDGRVVHPSEVTYSVPTDDRPFLVIECPSEDFLAGIKECPKLQPYLNKSNKTLAVVVHMTPAHIFNSMDYQSWMSGFHSSTDHMVINREAGAIDVIRAKEHQARLNLVDQQIFPLLPDCDKNTTYVVRSKGGCAAAETQRETDSQPEFNVLNKQGQVVKACQGLHYVYRGKHGLGFQIEVDDFQCSELQKEFLSIPEVQKEIAIFRQIVAAETCTETNEINLDEESVTSYPKVIFLGTGSSEPNLIRAQSCIVVQVSKHSVIILDCGEDSYGQIYRFFGKTKASNILRKVKAIFISHLHADHHLGLFSILKERKVAFDEKNVPFVPALLIAPIQMRRWLRFYHTELETVTHLFRYVKHQQNLDSFFDGVSLQTATFDDIKKELNFTEYTPIEVQHCNNAYGVTFTHANGFKLVYSGDTSPCDSLVTAGAGCDLLIHEATHEDRLHAYAKASKHSTFSEAIDVGQRMGAKNIILTHFSQRYAYMVPLFDIQLPRNVGIAFDNMQVCPRTIRYLPHMIPALSSLFATELKKFESKHSRRLLEEAESSYQQ